MYIIYNKTLGEGSVLINGKWLTLSPGKKIKSEVCPTTMSHGVIVVDASLNAGKTFVKNSMEVKNSRKEAYRNRSRNQDVVVDNKQGSGLEVVNEG